MRSLVLGLVAGVCLVSPALAATVQPVQGQVSINRGEGFQPLAGKTQARPGDLVMASPGGEAKILYADGCMVNVKPVKVVSVGAKSPCKAQYYAGLIDREPDEDDFLTQMIPFGIGAAAVFTAFCISTDCFGDDDRRRRPAKDRPASP